MAVIRPCNTWMSLIDPGIVEALKWYLWFLESRQETESTTTPEEINESLIQQTGVQSSVQLIVYVFNSLYCPDLVRLVWWSAIMSRCKCSGHRSLQANMENMCRPYVGSPVPCWRALHRTPNRQMASEKVMKPFPFLTDEVLRLSILIGRLCWRPSVLSPSGAVSSSTSPAAGGFSTQPWALKETPVSCPCSSSYKNIKAIRHPKPSISQVLYKVNLLKHSNCSVGQVSHREHFWVFTADCNSCLLMCQSADVCKHCKGFIYVTWWYMNEERNHIILTYFE